MTGVQTETGVLAGEERMLIDGELQFTGSGAKFDVIHPASEEVAGQATDGSVADMERAVGAARRAFDTTDWSRDLEFRYHCLTQLHEALEKDKERLRRILITEVGCPVTVSGSQIESPIEEVKHWAEHGHSFEYLVDTGVHPTQLGPAKDPLRARWCGRCDHAVERAVLPQHRRDGAGTDGGKHGRAQARAADPVVGQ
jgi:aldehyde dehydrogenase (NAD+)